MGKYRLKAQINSGKHERTGVNTGNKCKHRSIRVDMSKDRLTCTSKLWKNRYTRVNSGKQVKTSKHG